MTIDLKGYQQWQVKKSVAMRESNDNIDHKNMIIIWISFEDEKYFYYEHVKKLMFKPFWY